MASLPVYRPKAWREPFNFDWILRALDKVPFSPPFLVIIPALIALHSDKVNGVSLIPKDPSNLDAWKSTITPNVLKQYIWPLAAVGWIALKTINRILTRVALNNGRYAASPAKWDKEIAVVTGGANGIGKEIAVRLAEKSKKKVVVIDYGAMTYSHPNIVYYQANVADEDRMTKVAEEIRRDVGDPTIVVNNAGIAIGKTIVNTQKDSIERVMNVNSLAHVWSAKIFLPSMIKNNHGHIVTVASVASYMALAQLSAYAMSKAAALAFHEVLKHELRARYKATKVRNTIVCPTKVDTMLGQNMADHPSKFFTPLLAPETVAIRIVEAIDNGLSEHIMLPIYTEVLPILRGLPAWMKRIVEIIGQVDSSVTDASEQVAVNSGYAKLHGLDMEIKS